MAVVLVPAFVALTLRLFVFPDLNPPERSGAIVVLGGSGAGPIEEGVKLAREGYAPAIAFSVVPGSPCPRSIAHLARERIVCFRADPLTTQGEARAIERLALPRRWQRVIVVMPTTQATRARLRIGRCWSGEVLEVAVTPRGIWGWVHGIVYEWGALGKALVLQPTC
jgi:hypothetical protein